MEVLAQFLTIFLFLWALAMVGMSLAIWALRRDTKRIEFNILQLRIQHQHEQDAQIEKLRTDINNKGGTTEYVDADPTWNTLNMRSPLQG